MDIEEIRKIRVDIRDIEVVKKVSVKSLKEFVETIGGWSLLASFKSHAIYKHTKPMDLLDLLWVDDLREGYYQVMVPSIKDDNFPQQVIETIKTLEKTDPENRTQIQILEILMGAE